MAGERFSLGVSIAELDYYTNRVKELEKEVEELGRRAEANEMLFREYEQVRLVVFQLTTEYRGCSTKIEKDEDRQRITILTNRKYKELQGLRKKFYYHLHRVAYRTRSGWVVFRNLPSERLERVIEEMNSAIEKVTGEGEAITVMEVLFPKSYLAKELRKYLKELGDKLVRTRDKIEKMRELAEEEDDTLSRKLIRAERETEFLRQMITISEDELARYSI